MGFMIVTSTSNIENYIVTNYIGLINANIVIGTNFISDFFASLTDEIGGYSYSYQDKLDRIYQKALNELKLKAVENGANALLGVHFDFDEVSGKGKSMFMVTAIGTAVKVIPNKFVTQKSDRYDIYQKLYNLTLFKDSGVITQEQYEAEKNNLILVHKEEIERDIESIKTDSMKIEIEKERKKEAFEKEIKEKEFKESITEKYNLVRTILKGNIVNPEQKLKFLTLEKIKQANYESLEIDKSKSISYNIGFLLKENKVAEACNFYMTTTNYNDVEFIRTYIQGIYDAISFKFQTTFEKFALKLIELKNDNKREEAIKEFAQYAICDMNTAEKIIDLL